MTADNKKSARGDEPRTLFNSESDNVTSSLLAPINEGASNLSADAREIIATAKRGGAHKLRRVAEACRLAGRNGVSPGHFATASEESLAASGLFSRTSAWRWADRIDDALSAAYVRGAKDRARVAADAHLDAVGLGAGAKGDYVAPALVETIASAALPLWPEEVEQLALEMLEARGLDLSPLGRSALLTRAKIAARERSAVAAYVPSEGQDWPTLTHVDPFDFASRAPTSDERAEAEIMTPTETRSAAVVGGFKLAREMVTAGTEGEQLSVLLRLVPGLQADGVIEISEVVADGLADGWIAPKSKAAPVAATARKADAPRELTFDLASEPGLMGDVARWFDKRAYRPVSEFNLPAVLATGAALFGRRIATPTGLGLNLYLIATADTTGGKDALVSGPEAILAACGLRHLKGPGDFASDAAIEKAVRARPSHLMAIDEFGKVAQAMYGRNAPHFVKLAAKSFLALYPMSAPDREWSGKERATDERDSASEVVFSPTLTVLGVSTPEGLFEGVPETVLNDGTLNRFTLFVGGKPGPRQRDPARLNVPADLVDRVRAAYAASGAGGDMAETGYRSAGMKPAMRCVRWAGPDAEAAFIEIEEWQDVAEERGLKGLAGRAAEQSVKIATIRAAFRDPKAPEVTADDLAWAFAVVHKSIRDLEAGVRANMASNELGMVLNAVQRAIVGAGQRGISRTDLLRAAGVRHADERLVKTALERLQATEVIYEPALRPGRGGVVGMRYFARFDD